MGRVYCIKTRFDFHDSQELGEYLDNYITDYNELQRRVFYDLVNGHAATFNGISKYITYICQKYNVTKRTVNSIVHDVKGRIRALIELKKRELKQKEIKLESIEQKISNGKHELSLLKPVITSNKATQTQLAKYKQLKTSVYWATMKRERIKHQIQKLKSGIQTGKVSICFGSRKLFNSQHNLQANNFKTHEAWHNCFRKQRDSNIFYLGSGDESYGNQMLQLIPQPDGTYIMQLRKENKYCKSNKMTDKRIIVKGIKFKYLSDWLKLSIESDAPVTYRIKRVNNKWYLYAMFHIDVTKRSTSKYGVVGLDFNNGFIEAVITDRYGNIRTAGTYNLKYHGTGNKAKTEMEQTVSEIVRYCQRGAVNLVIENLDFVKKKSQCISRKGKKYNRMIHQFDYSRYKTLCQNLCEKYGVNLQIVSPYNTSKIGKQKYANQRKLSVHRAAAYVIARRGQGFTDELAS